MKQLILPMWGELTCISGKIKNKVKKVIKGMIKQNANKFEKCSAFPNVLSFQSKILFPYAVKLIWIKYNCPFL